MTVTRKVLEDEVKKVMADVIQKTKTGCFPSVASRDAYALDSVQLMLSRLLSTNRNPVIVEF